MDYLSNPRIFGSFLIGLSLVAGAYIAANFGRTNAQPPPNPGATIAIAPAREFIPTSDKDGDGVEDWRDLFVAAPAVDLSAAAALSDYNPPTTLTERLGVSLAEDIIRMKVGGPITKTQSQVITGAVTEISDTATKDKIYDVRDVTISNDQSDATVRSYANAVANILITHNVPDVPSELELLTALTADSTENSESAKKLSALAQMYKNYRDQTLALKVPRPFVKVHLDLVNVYHSLYLDIEAMTKAQSDPLVALVRLKRYEEDATGLRLAMDNWLGPLMPYDKIIEAGDPVLAIVAILSYQASP